MPDRDFHPLPPASSRHPAARPAPSPTAHAGAFEPQHGRARTSIADAEDRPPAGPFVLFALACSGALWCAVAACLYALAYLWGLA